MTSTLRKPRRRASSTRSYCRRWLSLDLRLGRLPDAHHGFPLQNGRRKEVSARHRCPPLLRRAERHVGASASIMLSARQHDDDPGGGFEIAQPSAGSHLTVMQRNPSAVPRMSAIVNLDVAPKTGRVNGRRPGDVNEILFRPTAQVY